MSNDPYSIDLSSQLNLPQIPFNQGHMPRLETESDRKYDPYAEDTGLVTDPRQLRIHASLALWVKEIGETLDKHYPGWAWTVEPDQRNMIINILNLHLHDQWGYTIRLQDVQVDRIRRMGVQAGGEILERFGLPRLGYRHDLLSNIVKTPGRTDAKGRLIPECRDKMTRQQLEKDRLLGAKSELATMIATEMQKHDYEQSH